MDTNQEYKIPGEIFLQFNESTWKKQASGKVTLRGIYSKGEYATRDQKYIDFLTDELTDTKLTVIMPANIRATLQENAVVDIDGFIDRWLNPSDCSVRLQLQATGASTVEAYSRISAAEQEKYAIRLSKTPERYQRIDTILKDKFENGITPKIVLILARSSITAADFYEALAPAQNRYHITELRASFTQPREVIERLQNAIILRPSLVCLVRGGGPDIKQMDNPEILRKAASYSCPLATAIGHTVDHIVLNEIADASFGTPSHLGAYLRDIALETELRMKETKQLKNDKRLLLDKLDTNRKVIT